MFENDKRNAAPVEQLYATCADLNPGDVLTHEVIRSILECEPHTEHWPRCLYRLRRRLRHERSLTIWPVPTVGYRFLTPAETLTLVPEKRTRKAYRQHGEIYRSAEALKDRSLTAHQRRQRMVVMEMARDARKALRRQLREQEEVIKATPVLPRRPILGAHG